MCWATCLNFASLNNLLPLFSVLLFHVLDLFLTTPGPKFETWLNKVTAMSL